MQMQKLILAADWRFKGRNPSKPVLEDIISDEGWLGAVVPGTVHQDLLRQGLIPDPFYGLNEEAVQWVGECDWLYRCRFELSPQFEASTIVDLCMDGLDTFATVWLNREFLFSSDNMFVPYRTKIKDCLKKDGAINELVILFEAAFAKGRQREAEHQKRTVWNGDSSRTYVRKAQYHYGWDWGPTLLTAGIWQEVRLEAYTVRISQLNCPAYVTDDLAQAQIEVNVELESLISPEPENELNLELTLHGPEGGVLAEVTSRVEANQATLTHSFLVQGKELELWWPNGYGSQPLYKVTASLRTTKEETLDRCEQRIGLRRLRLVQEPLSEEEGTTFLFEVNNRPVFCSGANWIPADSFTPRISSAKYEKLVELAAEANMVMLRVWGGGIYESEAFYNRCDELGVLIWQDFMFACGLYPADNWFVEGVREEVRAVLLRLRHHPSIVVWCGNNEDYMLADTLGVYDPQFNGDFNSTAFPARFIYEEVLPQVCAEVDPTRPYWPGSPYGGGGKNSNSALVGDRHTWEVWHQDMAPYQDYPKYQGRFVSEYGLQSYPELSTITSFTSTPFELHPQSRIIEAHNKGGGGSRRLAAYVNDVLRATDDLESYIYATQFVQAEAVVAGMKSWQRKWAGMGRYSVAGALVWQLNDCWPAISWSLIDYFLRPKPAYYALRRECASPGLGIIKSSKANQIEIWGFNTSGENIAGKVFLRKWSLDGTMLTEESFSVELLHGQSTEFGIFNIGYELERGTAMLNANLVVNGQTLARTNLWPEPLKYVELKEPEIKITRTDNEDTIKLETVRPVRGIWLSWGEAEWEDNFLDLVPGEVRVIRAKERGFVENASLEVRWLGKDKLLS
jgi:beta-mannosidase